ncbi:Vascular endothelial growth factor receptor 2 [Stylophora pistillata]|uniref:Vascular endothelial growth factor receptor 2 n=1 Tax=Stylophora pistillata TaxID=50429 RepID=A0A2B4R9J0_STYPI|nr:Vascular endothelial growth factor receptor 2 [Stylophora pistillata]
MWNRILLDCLSPYVAKASAQVVPETHLTLKKGEVLTLTCKVNEKTVKITWKKDGESLQERAVIDTRLHETKSKLVITELGEEDSGKYCCEATNKLGTVARSSVTLDVKELPTVEIFPKEPHSILEGGTLKLTCLFQKVKNVTWKKDGATNIQNAIVKTEKGKSNITISDTQPDDSGKYSCEAFNQAGSKSADAMVNIMARRQLAEVPSSSSLEWYFIGGPVVAVIFLLVLTAYIKTRRAIVNYRPVPIFRHRFGPCCEEQYEVEMGQLNANTDEWEIAVDRLNFREPIGRGAFGSVWRALLGRSRGRRGNRTVAAKCYLPISGEQGKKALMREIELLKLFGRMGHENVVKFIGCVTVGAQPILIMEYMWRGDLLGYLRKSRGVFDHYHRGVGRVDHLTTYDMVLFAKQIANGGIPYEGWSETSTIRKIYQGYRLPKPEHIDDSLYAVMLSCWQYQIAARPHFLNLYKTMDTYLKTKTYVDIVDMDKYDHDKYRFIDDRGAFAIREDAGPDEQGAATANPNRELGEHGATAHPFVVGINHGATTLPLTISVGDKGTAAANPDQDLGEHGATAHSFGVAVDGGATGYPFRVNVAAEIAAAANTDRKVGEHGATAHPFVAAIEDGARAFPLGIKVHESDTLAYLSENEEEEFGDSECPLGLEEEDIDDPECPLAIEEKDIDLLPSSLVMDDNGLGTLVCPLVTDEENPDCSACSLVIEEKDSSNYSACSPMIGEEGLEATACPSGVTEKDPNFVAHRLAIEVNKPDASQFAPVIGEEDVDSFEYPPMIEEESHFDSASPPDVGEGGTSNPETNADNQDAAAVQSVKEARGDEEPKTCQLENTEDEQDNIGKDMEDQGDAVDLCDEEVGVQESNGYQLTAVDKDETGNDEDEESSGATPFVQD